MKYIIIVRQFFRLEQMISILSIGEIISTQIRPLINLPI